MIKISEASLEGTNNLTRILKGSGVAIILTALLLIIYSALLTYTGISEDTIPVVIIVITALSILVGSFFSSINIRKNGLTNGALVGLIYILLLYLVSSIVSKNFGLSMYSIIMIIASVMAGAIGGIIAVNKK